MILNVLSKIGWSSMPTRTCPNAEMLRKPAIATKSNDGIMSDDRNNKSIVTPPTQTPLRTNAMRLTVLDMA